MQLCHFSIVAAALLLTPSSAWASGIAPRPLPLETVVRCAAVVLVGRTLGVREAQVRVRRDEAGLPPGEPTHLEFTVRQIGIRVDGVIGADPHPRVEEGTELWLTDPGDYRLGLSGERAAVRWMVLDVYRPSARLDLEKPGTRVIAFAETSADRAARGARVAGLAEVWWQVTTDAFETVARRREVERLRRAGAGPHRHPVRP